ncbi:hypothetical protein TNCV_4760301 [Trichonephila clavipes]|uniref:Uncharacterized protein n=1 Tax=Trichonephila clavipes TaxID=2585209 RepID=A0A8X6UUI2_TRICX|nr:hypothetical protein TNCV_4760301 [Trichonephila clavipes]
MRDFFGGVPREKKFGGVTGIGLHAVSMPSLDSRLLWGRGSHEKKIGGVTGNGLHAVSMSSLDSRLLWGVPRKKSAESPEMDFHAVSMSSLDSRLLWGGVPREKIGGVTGN